MDRSSPIRLKILWNGQPYTFIQPTNLFQNLRVCIGAVCGVYGYRIYNYIRMTSKVRFLYLSKKLYHLGDYTIHIQPKNSFFVFAVQYAIMSSAVSAQLDNKIFARNNYFIHWNIVEKSWFLLVSLICFPICFGPICFQPICFLLTPLMWVSIFKVNFLNYIYLGFFYIA